ncbi:hypothetical protein AYL99_09737 [Fonsecaea erecta]|uniref:Major facilitator superfamily (MFS) profile domain-containing protein n=1 Tax=Fonsecaea erecta TaxID=1367422 RepID=A0A178Z9U4_9EURO|nr:hypothetical protein AYL99_09737 [Fonsecaea erecta]OAP56558.1 hypothetical protein AYL99_09737 [Fonsecaea erecta]
MFAVDFVVEEPALRHSRVEGNPSSESSVQQESVKEPQPRELSRDVPLHDVSLLLAGHALSGAHVKPPLCRTLREPEDNSIFWTRESAELMRYFIDNCACFFDFSDAKRHFAYEVPLRARQNATLANAMLALAARHRSRADASETFAADQYYNACLQTMIPRLGDKSAIEDDELLAAIVILRLLEEMDVPIVGSDHQKHLFGTQAIITASQSRSEIPVTALRRACYWAAFRQEIFMSLTAQRPFNLILPDMEPPTSPSDDWSWTLQATYQCGKVESFVFGEESVTMSRYLELMDDIETWQRERPVSFDPVYQETGRLENSFPDIQIHMDCHVMGWQYITMAHLLLNVHCPLPRVGPAHKLTMTDMEKVIQKDVRTLCGIAQSNPHTPPASLVACMAIALCNRGSFRFQVRAGASERSSRSNRAPHRVANLHGTGTARTDVEFNMKDPAPPKLTRGEFGDPMFASEANYFGIISGYNPRPANLRYVYLLTAFVSLGALLFGYDQGVMGIIVADNRWMHLMKPANSWVTGAVVSLYDIGCFLGAMSIGYLADQCGRERTLSIASTVFCIGAVIQAASYDIPTITIGRVILGYGVGACAAGVPLYVSEIAPAGLRGRIIGIEQMILCFGELIAFWLDYGFAYLDTSDWWRIPLAIQILPAAVLAVGCWSWVPPSPRWLVQQDRHTCAREVLARLHGDQAAEIEIQEIAERVAFEKTVAVTTWRDMFTWPVLRVTLVGTGVQFFQQITGTNSILYYTPSLYERGGITSAHTRNLATGGVGIVLFVFAWIPIFVFDRLGRKTWLQIGVIGMMGAMIGITVLQWHAGKYPGAKGNYAIVVFPYLFYVFFNISWGVGSWTYASEIWPVALRAKGNALSTMSLWAGCYIVAQASPPVGDAIGWGLYIIYSGICVLAFFFVRYTMVETRGRSLEEMSRLFGLEDKFAARGGIDPATASESKNGDIVHEQVEEVDK